MITALIKKTVLQTECSKADPQLSAGDVLLDIETTGLKSSHCQIFCIGTAIISSDGLEITQRFCFSPEGEKQILEYLDRFDLTTGYMISFNFNEKKKPGVERVSIGDRTLFEATV